MARPVGAGGVGDAVKLFPEARRISLALVIAFYGTMTGIAWAVAHFAQGRVAVVLPGREPADWKLALGIGAGAGLLLVGLSHLFDRWFEWSRRLTRAIASLLGPLRPIDVVVLSVCSAIGEEVLFRGVLLPWVGLAGSSLLFGLMHVGPSRDFLPWMVLATFVGLGLGVLTEYTGDVGAAVIAHLTINYFNLQSLRSDGRA